MLADLALIRAQSYLFATQPTISLLLEPAGKRAAAEIAMQQHGISERRACRLTGLARSTQRRKRRVVADDSVAKRLKELARQRQRFGYRRLTALLRREGQQVNHKRIYRLYRDLGLAMRRRKRKRSA